MNLKLQTDEKEPDAFQFPEDLQAIIKGLDQNNRQIIINILKKYQILSFSDIQSISKINSSLLSNHLNQLIELLLVTRYYDHLKDGRAYSYYELSTIGRRMVDALEAAFYGVTEVTETIGGSFFKIRKYNIPSSSGERLSVGTSITLTTQADYTDIEIMVSSK